MIRWFHRTRKNFRRSLSDWYEGVRRRHRTRMKGVSSWLSWLRRIEPTGNDVCRSFGTRGRIRVVAMFNPVFWFLQFGGFLLRYLSSRGVINLFMSTPALCGLIAPVVLKVWVAPDLDSQVARAANRMGYYRDNKDYVQAEFHSRILCALKPEDEVAFFRRAEILDLMERPQEARELLSNLAVQRSYLPAWLLICQRDLTAVINAKSEPADDRLAGVLEANLQQLIGRFPQTNQGRLMLGMLYMHQNRSVESLAIFEAVTKSSTDPLPEAWYFQSLLQQQLGRDSDARASAAIAADRLLMRNAERPATAADHLQAIRALVLAGRESEAVQLVESRLRLAKSDSERVSWSSLKGEVCAAWSQRLRTRPNSTAADFAQSIQVLFEGVRSAPGQPLVLDELSRLAISNRISGDEIQGYLQIALDSGVSPGLVHFILGTRAATATPPDVVKADEHFQLALAHDAAFPGLLNNLADMIAGTPDGNFDEAMKLADQALRLLPGQPEIHDTRGKLLLKLGQPMKAIAEFEQALREPAIRAEVYSSMAAAWKTLGDSAKAADCEATAQALRTAKLAKQPGTE
jgi:tetratricopeptide (TPR) repeat protein